MRYIKIFYNNINICFNKTTLNFFISLFRNQLIIYKSTFSMIKIQNFFD